MSKTSIFFLLSFFIPNPILGQVDDSLIQNQTHEVVEKVYLQTDRDFYFFGDTIWYKAYLLDGQNHSPVTDYQNLHVEVFDTTARIAIKQIQLFENGFAKGSMIIPDTIVSGPYIIRSYTDYQRNLGEDWLFHKAIRISESKNSFELESESSGITNTDTAINISFFPEGGFLLSGIQNLVAFKAIDHSGKGIYVQGTVLDGTGSAIVAFKTDYKGMGRLFFTPEAGESYQVIIEDFPDFKYQFRDIREEGSKLSLVEQNQKELSLTVLTNHVSRNREPSFVACFTKDSLRFVRKIRLRGSVRVKIETATLAAGINRFTLLNNKLEPLSNRLVFIQPDTLNLNLETNQNTFSTRQEVKLHINNNFSLNSDTVHVSVSVVNEHALFGETGKQNILSYLLLDSELKGFIESPADHFIDDQHISSGEKLNLLMMTHGWSNYISNHKDETPVGIEYPRKAGICITGKAERKSGNRSHSNEPIILGLFSKKEHLFLECQSDSLGEFSIDSLFFTDTAFVFARVISKKRMQGSHILVNNAHEELPPISQVEIRNMKHIPDIPLLLFRQKYNRDADYREFYGNKDAIVLEEVSITEERIGKDDGHIKIYQQASDVLELKSSDEHYINILDYLKGKVAGVRVAGNIVSIRNKEIPMFVVDGIPIGNSDKSDPEYRDNSFGDDAVSLIETIPTSNIEKVEILKGADAAMYGARGAEGVIAIYTKKSEDVEDSAEPARTITQKVLGFSGQLEFYNPKYTSANINNPAPDHRTTLFWNPEVTLDPDHPAELSFFTADDLGYYRIIIEGITENGRICLGEAGFVVDSYTSEY